MKCFWARNCRWWGPAKRTKNDSNLYDNFIIKQLNYLVNPAVSCSDAVIETSFISLLSNSRNVQKWQNELMLLKRWFYLWKIADPDKQYGLLSFQGRDTKLDRLLAKNQYHFWDTLYLKCQLTKYNNFLWGYFFLAKSLSNFVSLPWKLNNPHHHIEDNQFS